MKLFMLIPFLCLSCATAVAPTKAVPRQNSGDFPGWANEAVSELANTCVEDAYQGGFAREAIMPFCKCVILTVTQSFSQAEFSKLCEDPKKATVVAQAIGKMCLEQTGSSI